MSLSWSFTWWVGKLVSGVGHEVRYCYVQGQVYCLSELIDGRSRSVAGIITYVSKDKLHAQHFQRYSVLVTFIQLTGRHVVVSNNFSADIRFLSQNRRTPRIQPQWPIKEAVQLTIAF